MRHSQQNERARSRRGQSFTSENPAQDDRDRREYRDYDEDYDNYRGYDDIEDEGYERRGYGRSSGRGGVGRSYNFRERHSRDYDERDYDFEGAYRDEDVRGRRGLAAMDPEEQHAISSRDEHRSVSRRTTR